MTPLWNFYVKRLPAKLVWPALALTYAIGLSVLVLGARAPYQNIIYVDVSAAE